MFHQISGCPAPWSWSFDWPNSLGLIKERMVYIIHSLENEADNDSPQQIRPWNCFNRICLECFFGSKSNSRHQMKLIYSSLKLHEQWAVIMRLCGRITIFHPANSIPSKNRKISLLSRKYFKKVTYLSPPLPTSLELQSQDASWYIFKEKIFLILIVSLF